jgi:hypothetical protein
MRWERSRREGLVPRPISRGREQIAATTRVASDPLCLHAVATTPAGSMELIRSYRSTDVGLPHITVGSAPALHFSRPAQRSLALQPADSPSRLMRPSTPEAPTALLPPPPLRLLPGGAIQFPGESYLPLWTSAFSRRTVMGILRQQSQNPVVRRRLKNQGCSVRAWRTASKTFRLALTNVRV